MKIYKLVPTIVDSTCVLLDAHDTLCKYIDIYRYPVIVEYLHDNKDRMLNLPE